MSALGRGFRRLCPRCGEGRMFSGYLTVPETCPSCSLAFEPLRADDAPAYFTIFIVGHIIVSGLLLVQKLEHPDDWVQFAIWIPLTIVLTFGLLPFVKGAVMGAIYASRAGRQQHPAE
ncbi:MAG TPA: DUF983 domain-containing protein [Dongiaceae bacterium]|nr:DUF983 domain-containing protein [Dongiaceae bacterium]